MFSSSSKSADNLGSYSGAGNATGAGFSIGTGYGSSSSPPQYSQSASSTATYRVDPAEIAVMLF
ncbi:uncharacterized protein CELE_C04C3.14 [Caenorhabditis elegans]|uniref:Uncharacterized protein n=1 Tax=Caenorhabditis elegans TaxID=6239 RepID=I2HAC2_CAEEL|nr:Uncharacterized protein CELE_C04C3.14 [Caenorhabditis elegans]CCH63829.1 Uncharacterized protein CELE_C04C3.14 [Caenorhabditis elegans]|eukprot:NP_001255249.1 Uncharacterized protein CELE_C04C3.14 [Caenorhabditis elegans]